MKKKFKEEFDLQLRMMSTHAVMRSQIISDRLKINPTDLETLEILFREGKIPAGKLAEHTGLTTGAVTGVIDRLVRAGFVTRELDPKDRRKVLVALNLKKVNKEIVPLYDSLAGSVGQLIEAYSEKELGVIMDFLKKATSLSQKDLEELGEKKRLLTKTKRPGLRSKQKK